MHSAKAEAALLLLVLALLLVFALLLFFCYSSNVIALCT
jgi:hypothetical protein